MYNTKLTATEIANATGISKPMIQKKLADLNIKPIEIIGNTYYYNILDSTAAVLSVNKFKAAKYEKYLNEYYEHETGVKYDFNDLITSGKALLKDMQSTTKTDTEESKNTDTEQKAPINTHVTDVNIILIEELKAANAKSLDVLQEQIERLEREKKQLQEQLQAKDLLYNTTINKYMDFMERNQYIAAADKQIEIQKTTADSTSGTNCKEKGGFLHKLFNK